MTYSAGFIFVSREQQTRLIVVFIGQLEFELTHESFSEHPFLPTSHYAVKTHEI